MIPFKEILLSPGDFFEELNKKPESLKIPALFILISGIAAGISAAVAASATTAMIPEEAAFLTGIIPIIAFIFALVLSFIVWLIWAGVMHVISLPFGGKGSFNRTLEITGYGILPQIAGTLISAVLMYLHMSSLTFSAVTSQADIEALTTAISTGPLMMAASIIAVIFVLWSANIWIFGFIKCRKMELKKAAIAVGIPVLAYIIMTVSSVI